MFKIDIQDKAAVLRRFFVEQTIITNSVVEQLSKITYSTSPFTYP
jgi:hypothetical protein